MFGGFFSGGFVGFVGGGGGEFYGVLFGGRVGFFHDGGGGFLAADVVVMGG